MTMVLEAGDPLVELGLVDPATGKALETSDWKPPEPETPKSPVSDQYDQERDQATQAQDTQQAPAAAPGINPNSGQAPAAQPDPKGDARTYLQTETTRLQQDAQQAIWLATNYGIQGPDGQLQKLDLQTAQALVGRELQAQMSEIQRQADRIALAPMAKEMAARDIAKQHSLPGVTIKAEDLLSEDTPAGMKARAKTLAETARDGKFQDRKADRRDRVEAGGSSSHANTDDMDSFTRIRLGLLRGE